jgi:hypothetical protein
VKKTFTSISVRFPNSKMNRCSPRYTTARSNVYVFPNGLMSPIWGKLALSLVVLFSFLARFRGWLGVSVVIIVLLDSPATPGACWRKNSNKMRTRMVHWDAGLFVDGPSDGVKDEEDPREVSEERGYKVAARKLEPEREREDH